MGKGRMFQDVKATWNPVVGCSHNCSYCWARRLAETRLKNRPQYADFKPKLVKHMLRKIPNKSPIFVADMGDLFCDAVEPEWVDKVLSAIEDHCVDIDRTKGIDAEKPTFYFLTKNPIRYYEFLRKLKVLNDTWENIALGITIETDLDYSSLYHHVSDAPSPVARLYVAKHLRKLWAGKMFISIEPILRFTSAFPKKIAEAKPDWVYVGYDNYNNKLDEPRLEDTEFLIWALEEVHGIKVIRKEIRRAWYEEDEQ